MEPDKKPSDTTGQPPIAPLRTFKSDVEDAVKKGATATSIALAEQRRRTEETGKEKTPLNPLYKIAIDAGAVLVLAGLILLSVYFFVPPAKPPERTAPIAKFITINSERDIAVDTMDRPRLIAALQTIKGGGLL